MSSSRERRLLGLAVRWRWAGYALFGLVLASLFSPSMTNAEQAAIAESDDGDLIYMAEWLVQMGKAAIATGAVVLAGEVIVRILRHRSPVPIRERLDAWIPPGRN